MKPHYFRRSIDFEVVVCESQRGCFKIGLFFRLVLSESRVVVDTFDSRMQIL